MTGAALAQGPSWDNSGNSLLSGNTYYFRQVYYSPLDNNGDLGVEFALYGNISFSANGTYTLANANLIQYYVNNGSVVGPTSSTYSLPSPEQERIPFHRVVLDFCPAFSVLFQPAAPIPFTSRFLTGY